MSHPIYICSFYNFINFISRKMAASIPFQQAHQALAGTYYNGIQDAGTQNLKQHCGEFPINPYSAIIPAIFTSEFNDYIDPNTSEPVRNPHLPTSRNILQWNTRCRYTKPGTALR